MADPLSVSEPEFRLVFMLPSMLFTSTGLALFGYFTSTGQSAVLCASMQAVEVFGVLIGNIASNGYALDGFKEQSNEVFIMAMLVKVCARLRSFGSLCWAGKLIGCQPELPFLRIVVLCQCLGSREWTGPDDVCLRRHSGRRLRCGLASLHLRQKVQGLVGSEQFVQEVQHGDGGSWRTDGLIQSRATLAMVGETG